MVAVVEMLLLIILNESHMFRLVTTSLRQHGDIKSSKPVEKQKSLELFATQNLRRKDTDLQNTFAAKLERHDGIWTNALNLPQIKTPSLNVVADLSIPAYIFFHLLPPTDLPVTCDWNATSRVVRALCAKIMIIKRGRSTRAQSVAPLQNAASVLW